MLQTPLHTAVLNKAADVVEVLLQHGAQIHAADVRPFFFYNIS